MPSWSKLPGKVFRQHFFLPRKSGKCWKVFAPPRSPRDWHKFNRRGQVMKAHVWVMPKVTVLDPQGQTIERALGSLGFDKVKNVRQGKFFVLDMDGLSRDDAKSQVERI